MAGLLYRCAIVALLSPALLIGQYVPRRTRGVNPGAPGSIEVPAVTFQGKLKALSKKEMRIDAEAEQQSLTFRVTSKTHFFKDGKPIKLSDVNLETVVAVDAVRDPDQKLSALKVVVNPPKPKPAEQ